MRFLALVSVLLFSISAFAQAPAAAGDASSEKTAAEAMSTAAAAALKAATEDAGKGQALLTALNDLKTAAQDWNNESAKWAASAKAWAAGDATKQPETLTNHRNADVAKAKYDAALAKVKELKGSEKTTFSSDYNAKHFSLVAGAVVLNPFKLKSVDTDANPATTEVELETGKTDANFLFEAGFRRRWAWENWQSAPVRQLREELDALRTQIDAERKKTSPDAVKIGEWTRDAVEREQQIRAIRLLYDDDTAGRPRVSGAGWGESEQTGLAKLGLDALSVVVLPDNYTMRLGYALGSSQPSGAAAVAGAGDFYVEAGLGWDWVHALYPAGIEPLRISAGPEFFASFSNDSKLDDFHQRFLIGGALTAGVPLGEGEERLAEIVVRVGYVGVEVPEFLDDSNRLVKVEHQVADFHQEEGLGVDMEMNIPITKELGYLFLRATTNHGFDPNPWTTTVGYTLPIGNLVSMIRR
jgi:hypothetical protein